MKVRCSGYSPRFGKEVPATDKYFGGKPPISQQLSIRPQIACLNMDTIDFGNIPQYASSHRVVILRNLTDGDIIFEVNSSTDVFPKGLCHLMNDTGMYVNTLTCVVYVFISHSFSPCHTPRSKQ